MCKPYYDNQDFSQWGLLDSNHLKSHYVMEIDPLRTSLPKWEQHIPWGQVSQFKCNFIVSYKNALEIKPTQFIYKIMTGVHSHKLILVKCQIAFLPFSIQIGKEFFDSCTQPFNLQPLFQKSGSRNLVLEIWFQKSGSRNLV